MKDKEGYAKDFEEIIFILGMFIVFHLIQLQPLKLRTKLNDSRRMELKAEILILYDND